MRTIFTILCFFVVSGAIAQDKSDVFDKQTKVTWLGLDFTAAMLIGDRERLGSESDIRHLLESWNNLVMKEPEKYNIAQAIGKEQVENRIDVTLERNEELNVLELYSDNQKDHLHLKPGDIDEIIAGYPFKGLQGIGLMFNIESFSKLNVEASMWITFVDMGTRKVLFSERMTARPGGFGMRNYWARTVYDVLENMKKKEFEMWRKKYYRS